METPDPIKLRELAAWYREFADKTDNPMIWEARLQTAEDLERSAECSEMSLAAVELFSHAASRCLERQAMDIRHIFAANVRRLRRDKRLSQGALAERSGIDRSYLSRIETGAHYAGLDIVQKLAVALEADPAELLERPSSIAAEPR
jgi:DNA-binding Xre family transcriptional regulator